MINGSLFHNPKPSTATQLSFALFFPVFTIVALWVDSVYFTLHYFDARQLTNLLAVVYFSLFFYVAANELRKLMFVMVFLSYLGEWIFCKWLGMYAYRTDPIPLYVPFGHAIVYASGYVFANTRRAIVNAKKLQGYFAIAFIALFVSVGIFLNDQFTLIFGALFFVLLKRKRWQILYYFIALCVIFIELVGTYFQCWAWVPKTFGIIPAVNPPMGAVFFYAGGDVLLAKIVNASKIKKSYNL